MSMIKKDFIALADHIREVNSHSPDFPVFDSSTIHSLARFCKERNYAFKTERWFDYIAGECGPNGGSIKKGKK